MKKIVGVVLLVFLSAGILLSAQEANPASDFEYDLNQEGTGVVIKKYEGTSKDVIIPSSIEDFPIVEVDMSNTDIISVVLPDSVTYFDFKYCENLKKIVFPKDLKTIPSQCFYYCKELKEITLPQGLVKISSKTFSNSGLESIVIPDSVKMIDYGAFEKCENLKTITVGTGLESISREAFKGCTALTSIMLGDKLKHIDVEAFCRCTSLTSVKMGKGINIIRERAFEDCRSLTTFDIGVKELPYLHDYDLWKEDAKGYCWDVFKGCSSLSLKEKKKIKDTGYKGEF